MSAILARDGNSDLTHVILNGLLRFVCPLVILELTHMVGC